MKTYPKVSFALIGVLLSANLAFADEATNQPSAQSSTNQSTTPPLQAKPNTDKVYDLGRIEVVGDSRPDNNPTVSTISAEDIANTSSNDITQALRFTPGVFVTPAYGSRGEADINIRGFGRTRVGLFIDGIPVNSIYDRQTDFGQFVTADIAEISVSKGYTSPIYGMNTIGGAINIITSKPKDRLEIRGKYEFVTNNENRIGLSVGSNVGKYYWQASYSSTNRESLNLSNSYKPTAQQDRGEARNTYYANQTFKAKAGIQPNENHEYSLNFIYQKGSKGGVPSTTATRTWQWPNYDKATLYLLGNSKFSDKISLNSRVYYDSFYNILEGNTALGAAHNPMFRSIYNDYTLGGIFTLGVDFDEKKSLKLGVNVRNDNHNSQDPDSATGDNTKLSDISTSAFAEYAQRLNNTFRFALSGSYDRNDMTKAIVDGVADEKFSLQGWTLQGILYANINDYTMLHLNVGKKSKIPTLKDRYSTTFGSRTPNPNLAPESALNYELGVNFEYDSTKVSATAFYNDLTNMLVSFIDTTNSCSGVASGTATTCYRLDNAKEGYAYGAEVALSQGFFDDALVIGANYTFTERKITRITNANSQGDGRLLDYPKHMVNANIVARPSENIDLIFMGSYQSGHWRFVNTEYIQSASFFLLDLKTNYHVSKDLTLSLGAYNLLDKNYYYGAGYYMAGRRMLMGVEYKF